MVTAHQTTPDTDLKIKNIAVLTDFSKNADAALQYAAAVARQYGASLVLAHAYLLPASAYYAPDAALVNQALDDFRESLRNRMLNQTEGQSISAT